ncbi:hypothetical protein [Flavobacterium psychrotrophum]|uniref:hypothetical protein n=1 Tax=Flavobacterium psychrotrophum TaxID=2294119 RepID=UPI000E31A744|nr:hypothetical protein [Flavobacterium psychrotrophum]
MNKIILYILLIVSLKLSAQNLDYLKSQDTIYISLPKMFSETPSHIKYNKFDIAIDSNGFVTQYVFTDKDSVGKLIEISIRLNPKIVKDNFPIEVNRKMFLKTYKKQILNLDIIKQYRNREFFFGYLGARSYAPSKKVIYVIDEESLKRKDKNIILRKAELSTFGYMRI